MKIMMLYIAVMNVIGLLLMGADKKKAIRHQWRIPEKMLFACSLCGGCLETWLGMYVFRHKTKHWYFVVGMPLIFVAWVIGGILVMHYFGDNLSIL